ncbi:hypothetical protein [Streptomyces sp. NPDC096339]|uniref:hypothetical protein n=1 Tax=Streptomyces sp. NPDC096339 TaxID=3366086 RepID=UPI003815C01C
MRRLCLVVDVEKYSSRPNPAALDVQDRLLWAVFQACRAAGVDPTGCARQDQGDGQLLVMPAGIDEGHALPGVIRALRSALHQLNRRPGPGGRIRLRASVAQGLVHDAATGFVGDAVVHACRVLDSRQLREVLGGRQDSDLALAVTDDLYRDVLTQQYGEPSADQFSPLLVTVPGKGFRARGWVHAPRAGAERGLIPPYPGPGHGGAAPAEHRTGWARTVAAGAIPAAGAGIAVWAVTRTPWDASDHPLGDDGHPTDAAGADGHDSVPGAALALLPEAGEEEPHWENRDDGLHGPEDDGYDDGHDDGHDDGWEDDTSWHDDSDDAFP